MNGYGLYSSPHIESINIIDLTGDINNDFTVDIIDIVQLIDIILTGNTNEFLEICDINTDGAVNVLDVIFLVQIIISQ